jgi:hypothetical protein
MALVARCAGNKRAKPEDFMPGKKSNRMKLTMHEFVSLATKGTL